MKPAATARGASTSWCSSLREGGEPGLSEIDITSRGYWYEQFRRAQFDFDSQSVRPYFPYAKVETGVLETAERLFKVEFRRSNAPAWHEAVSVFEVFDGGRLAGRFYLDMHPREGKNKWFSAAPVVTGVRGRALPEAGLICNFPAGDGNDPGLLQYSDVVTFFHEFGHLMHAILGGHRSGQGFRGLRRRVTLSRCRRRCWKSFSATRNCCRRSPNIMKRARCCRPR